MTKEEAKELLPIITAFSEGKTIEVKGNDNTWDEVRYIDGYPGKYIILARRHADKWYIAGVNAQKETLNVKVHLPMISAGESVQIYTDNLQLEGSTKQVKMNKKQEVQLSIPCNGGFLIVK